MALFWVEVFQTIYCERSRTAPLYSLDMNQQANETRSPCEQTTCMYWDQNHEPVVKMIGDIRRTRNVLRCTYQESIVGGITIPDHLRNTALNKDEEQELGHFLVVICLCFRMIHDMFLGVHGFGWLQRNYYAFLDSVPERSFWRLFVLFIPLCCWKQQSWPKSVRPVIFKFGMQLIKY